MYSTIYYPQDNWCPYETMEGDETFTFNHRHWNEGPSFCVRLWVFEMPDD